MITPLLLAHFDGSSLDVNALLRSPYTVGLVAVVGWFIVRIIQSIASNLRENNIGVQRLKLMSKLADKGLLQREDLEEFLHESSRADPSAERPTAPISERERQVKRREGLFFAGFLLMGLSAGFFTAGWLAGIEPLFIPASILGALGLAFTSYGAARREVLHRIRSDVHRE